MKREEVYLLPLTDLIPKEFVIKRNYHTTWQSDKAMRFILISIKDDKGLLGTRGNKNTYWTPLSSLRNTRKNHLTENSNYQV